MTLLRNKIIPMKCIFKEDAFLLLQITPLYEFENEKRTDKIIGYIYECVDTLDFEKVKIKIKGQDAPLMENEKLQELRENGEKIAVEFINGVDLIYWSPKTKSLEDSFSAEDVRLVETEN